MVSYYSWNQLQRIKEAKNYRELCEIAAEVVDNARACNPGKPIAMVCGPISTGGKGSREENLRVFAQAIDRISGDGLLVFSQMPFEDDMARIYQSDPSLQGLRLLEEFYLPIFKTRQIKLLCFLPGWEKSTGATWEHEQAKKLMIPRIYLSEYYTTD